MELANVLDTSKDLLKKLNVENEVDVTIENVKKEFGGVVEKAIDSGANYIIKAMPINEHVKDVLIDVKSALKTKDFKEIVSTAINSSLREGMEILSIPKNVIKDITKVKDVLVKGGLTQALSAGVDLVLNKYVKNNLFPEYVQKFVTKLKDFIGSRNFLEKIDQSIKRCVSRVNKFEETCNKWYQAYSNFNLSDINEIANKLNNSVKKVSYDSEAVKTNDTIQNLTQFANNKKDKLSTIQLRACSLI